MKKISNNFFNENSVKVAEKLLGKTISLGNCSGYIVETEAYGTDDASHARKRTPRSELMYSSAGKVYIYLVYGMHYCLNFTCNKKNAGAVLIRAVQPVSGIEKMKKRRKIENIFELANGPGKVCGAFGINISLNGAKVNEKIMLFDEGLKHFKVGRTGRVGIKKAAELPWRFYIKNSKFAGRH